MAFHFVFSSVAVLIVSQAQAAPTPTPAPQEKSSSAGDTPKFEKLGVQKANRTYTITPEMLKQMDEANARAIRNSPPEVQRALIDAYNKSHPKK